MTCKNIGLYAGYVGVSLAVLIPLELPQAYYAYAEYNAISSLLKFLPVFSSTTILFNIFIMPCSWTLCFIAIAQMLDERDLPFKKANFSKVMVSLSIFLAILTIVNMGLFYGYISSELSSTLLSSFPNYLRDTTVSSSWERATTLLQCCGPNSANDYIEILGGTSPCSSFSLGCGQAIVNNFYVLWIWTLLSQIGTIVISLHGVWPKEKDESEIGWYDRIKSYFD